MKCILMNKNTEVLVAEYNTILKGFEKLYKIIKLMLTKREVGGKLITVDVSTLINRVLTITKSNYSTNANQVRSTYGTRKRFSFR